MAAVCLPQWAHVENPVATGVIRTHPEDFVVEEVLGFSPSGEGEHLFLYTEKRGLNTQEVAQNLARALMIHPKNISYSGLKDRQAVTRQWFSVHTRRDIDVGSLCTDQVRVLEVGRHRAKLKRGSHRQNRFAITVRELDNDTGLDDRIARVQARGVPNYFGEQRFGHNGGNIDRALEMFAGKIQPKRHQRGLYLSAARAFLFNEMLSRRVEQDNWATGLPGEAMILDGSNSFFSAEQIDASLQARLAAFDIHPSAPLWGEGESAASGDARALETEILSAWPALTQGLEAAGVRQLRRATRLLPQNLQLERTGAAELLLTFQLPRGAFATTVLRELITISQAPQSETGTE